MCGICLIYDSKREDNNQHTIKRMVAALLHRGPDEQNQLIRGGVALGHTRLSIVDIRGGSQPMLSGDQRYAIIYNGEIYNYQSLRRELEAQEIQFTTQSDTEVILHLYERHKDQCVEYLRGMFSFAVHDKETDRVFVARDRIGIKPLFYYWDGSTFYAASEMKALFATNKVPVEFDKNSIFNYFYYQFNISPFTPFAGIRDLPPGHTLVLESGQGPQIQQYWDLEFPRDGEYDALSDDTWMQRFDDALSDAVESHMIGEVPIGAYLSGGVDSSTTAYYLHQHYPEEVQTFTIQFSNSVHDESSIAQSIADHIGVSLHKLFVDDKRSGGYLDILERALYHVEQPQRMALDVPFIMLSELVRDHKYKVIYSGEGADEIFGGYDCYREDYIRIWGNQYEGEQQRLDYYSSEFGNNFAEEYLRLLASLHRPDLQHETVNKYGCYPAWYNDWHILEDSLDNIFSSEFKDAVDENLQTDQLAAGIKPKLEGLHPLNQSLYIEAKSRLAGWILWKGDRLSMANSVEARVPFLDHPLVELAAQLPPHLKLNGMDEKFLLRKIMMPRLPEHPYYFKKRGFYTPIREWFLSEENISSLEPYLCENAVNEAGIFDARSVRNLVNTISTVAAPDSMNDHYHIMKLEWLLLSILSIQILHHLFVKRHAPCFRDS